jgi:hypothetical protein
MSTTVVVNGLNYFIPAVGDNNWGQNVTDALVALATAASSNASVYNRVTVTSSPITVVSGRTYLVDTSSARTLNLPSPANNAYLFIKDTTGGAASNNITVHRFASESIDGTASDKTLNLNRGFWGYVSDGTNWFSVTPPYPLPYSFLTLTGSIVNADIATGAAIAYSKLALTGAILSADLAGSIAVNKLVALTTSKAVATDGSGFLVAATTTATELGFVSGVTSAIQTQLGTKAADTAVVHNTGAETVAGIKSFSSAIKNTAGTNTIQVSGVSTTGQIGNNYDLGSIPNAADSSAAISFLCPAGAASVLIATSATVNTAVSTVASFANAGVAILGTNTNDSAAAGFVGEVIESVAGFTNAPTSGQYGDLTSISLTAGDWSVSVYGTWAINTATVPAGNDSDVGVSTTTGNSSTGLVAGDTVGIDFLVASTRTQVNISIPPKRFSLSATTTVYLKYRSNYSAGVPQCAGRITATRRR